MASDVTLDLPMGKIGFAGTARGADDAPHSAFRIELPGRPLIYGEWVSIFLANGNDFSIAIASFGYASVANISNPHPNARLKFSQHEIAIIQELIEALFINENARSGIVPFSSSKGKFLRQIFYRADWIWRTPHPADMVH